MNYYAEIEMGKSAIERKKLVSSDVMGGAGCLVSDWRAEHSRLLAALDIISSLADPPKD